MPDEIKASVAHQPGPNPQRGYSKIGSENLGTVYRHDFAPKEQNPYKDMRVGTNLSRGASESFSHCEGTLGSRVCERQKISQQMGSRKYHARLSLIHGRTIPDLRTNLRHHPTSYRARA